MRASQAFNAGSIPVTRSKNFSTNIVKGSEPERAGENKTVL